MEESNIKKGLQKCLDCGLNVSTTVNELCVSCYLDKCSLKK